MRKQQFSRRILVTAIILAVWPGLQVLALHPFPVSFKEMFGSVFLVWFSVVLLRQDSDDDWAGQL
jgi:hypothetical protein